MVDLIIKSKTVWQTSDGVEHSTHEMAVQYMLNAELIEMLEERGLASVADGQDLINLFSDKSMRAKFREWLDATDAMEKASGL